MADLTHLNDGSVLANLRDRYGRWLIYVCEHLLISESNIFSWKFSRLIQVYFVLSSIRTNDYPSTR